MIEINNGLLALIFICITTLGIGYFCYKMSQELPNQFESCRFRFEEAVNRWREVGASDEVIESELAYLLENDLRQYPLSHPRDSAAETSWERHGDYDG